MRRLACLALGLLLVGGSAHAQAHFAGQTPRKGTLFGSTPKADATGPQTYGVAMPEPYRPHTASAAPKAPGVTDGGAAFKPFSGNSVYSNRGGVDAYGKPTKPKHSTYGY